MVLLTHKFSFINFNQDHKEQGLKDTTTFTFLVKVVSREKWLKAIELAQLYFHPMIFRRGYLKTMEIGRALAGSRK